MIKKFVLPLITVILPVCFTGCISERQQQEGIPGKVIVIPAKAGEKSFPAGGFIALGNRWASEQTEVYTALKGDTIMFEFVCYGNTKDLEWSEKKPTDDMTLFGGEHVELLIAPRGENDGGRYYHLALNPAGALYDAKGRDTTWSPVFVTKTEIKHDRWIATFEIKHTSITLDKTGATGGKWNLNFCRTIKKKGKSAEHSSWSGATDFHNIRTMGQLHFSGKAPSDQLRIFRCSMNKKGQLELTAEKTGKDHAFLQIFDNGELIHNEKITGTEPFKLSCDLKKNYVSLKGSKNISIYLLGPYRIPIQKFSANLASMEGKFLEIDNFEYINQKDLICSVMNFPGKAVIKNETGILREAAVTGKETKISLAELKAGKYVLEYTCDGKRSSRVFFIAQEKPAEAAALPEKGKLSIAGKDLKLDGKPFYLLGISGGSKTYFPVDPGFTLQYGKGFRKHALSYRSVPGRRLVRKPVTGYAYFKNWENILAKHFEKLKKEEKSAWNLLCYEASLRVLHTKQDGSLEIDPQGHLIYKKIYEMAKKYAPDSVFSIQVDNMFELNKYTESCDVLEYAAWSSSYHRLDMIKNFGKDFDFVRDLAKEKPLVVWLGGSIPTPESRTAEEVRAGVYYTILKGGAGNIIHMGHGGVPKERTRFWSMLSRLQREVDSFYADLKTWQETKLKLPENVIGKSVIGPDGESLTVLLSISDDEVQSEIDLPGSGKKLLTFTPYEPMVFRFKPEKKEVKKEMSVQDNKK